MAKGGLHATVTEARDKEECDCTPACTCCECSRKAKSGGREQSGSGEQPQSGVTPCDCVDCDCDPCADPNVQKKKTRAPKPCDCGECKCDPCLDPKMSKKRVEAVSQSRAGHPADCACPLCECEKEIDVIDGKMSKTTSFARKTPLPDNCDCAQCACAEEEEGAGPAETPVTTHEIPTHAQDCACAECACPEEDIAAGKMEHSEVPPKESEKETHSPDCICDECFCPDAPKIEAADSATCQCADCKNRPEPAVACTCSDCGADTAGHPSGCQCTQCLCKECTHGLPPQPTCWDTCACADCLCVECCKPKIGQRKLQAEGLQTETEDKAAAGDTAEEGKGEKVCVKRPDDPTKCGCLSCVCKVCSDTAVCKDATGACRCVECLCAACKNIGGKIAQKSSPLRGMASMHSTGETSDCKCIFCMCDACPEDAFLSTVQSEAGQPLRTTPPSDGAIGAIQSVHFATAKRDEIADTAMAVEVAQGETTAEQTVETTASSGPKIEAVQGAQTTKSQPAIGGQMAPCTCCLCNLGAPLVPDRSVVGSPGPMAASGQAVPNEGIDAVQIVQATTEGGPQVEVLQSLQVATSSSQPAGAAGGQVQGGAQMGSQPAMVPQKSGEQVGHCTCCTCLAKMGGQNPALVKRGLDSGAASGQMQPRTLGGSQLGVAASGQQVMPQGSMRVGSQPLGDTTIAQNGPGMYVTPSGQVVPQGSMRVGSQPLGDTTIAQNGPGMYVTQSGQVVPQGSMGVGSQPGVVASGQVVPQGSIRVGSQPGVAASGQQVVPQGSMRVGSQPGVAASGQQVVPQGSMRVGSQPGVAASGQVVPQGSMRVGSQPGVAASGQMVPQGIMRVGSQPGVAASGQVVPQGSMRVGSQPGVAASGQVVPQGSMRVGSQRGVAPVGSMQQQDVPTTEITAEQSVQIMTTELGSNVEEVQSVQIVAQKSAPLGSQPAVVASGQLMPQGSMGVGPQPGGQGCPCGQCPPILVPGFQSAGQVVPQGSTGVGPQPGGQGCPCGQCPSILVPASQSAGQMIPQGSMGVGPQPGVAASGQVGPQGSMGVGSQLGVAASGQVIPQGSTQVGTDTGDELTVQAEQSVHVVTDGGTKVDAVQSVHIVTSEHVVPQGSMGVGPQPGGQICPCSQCPLNLVPAFQSAGQMVPQGSMGVGPQPGVAASGQVIPQGSTQVGVGTGDEQTVLAQQSVHLVADSGTNVDAVQSVHIVTKPTSAASGQVVPQGSTTVGSQFGVGAGGQDVGTLQPCDCCKCPPMVQMAPLGTNAAMAKRFDFNSLAGGAANWSPGLQMDQLAPLGEFIAEQGVQMAGIAANAAAEVAQNVDEAAAKRGGYGYLSRVRVLKKAEPHNYKGLVGNARSLSPDLQMGKDQFNVNPKAGFTREWAPELNVNPKAGFTREWAPELQTDQFDYRGLTGMTRGRNKASAKRGEFGSQTAAGASGQMVPQGSMRVGSQPGVAASRQVVPQGQQDGEMFATQSVHRGADGAMEVIAEKSENMNATQSVVTYDQGQQVVVPSTQQGSRTATAAASRRMVPQGSMRVGSQPGVAASRQVVPQGSMTVGSQPFYDTTTAQNGPGMYVTQSGQVMAQGSTNVGPQPLDATQAVMTYDQGQQVMAEPSAAAASRQLAPTISASRQQAVDTCACCTCTPTAADAESMNVGAQAKRGQADGISPDYLGLTPIADMMGGLKKDEGMIRPAIRGMVPNPITMAVENPATQFELGTIPGAQAKRGQFNANPRAGLTREWTPGLEVNQFGFNPRAGLTREWTPGLQMDQLDTLGAAGAAIRGLNPNQMGRDQYDFEHLETAARQIVPSAINAPLREFTAEQKVNIGEIATNAAAQTAQEVHAAASAKRGEFGSNLYDGVTKQWKENDDLDYVGVLRRDEGIIRPMHRNVIPIHPLQIITDCPVGQIVRNVFAPGAHLSMAKRDQQGVDACACCPCNPPVEGQLGPQDQPFGGTTGEVAVGQSVTMIETELGSKIETVQNLQLGSQTAAGASRQMVPQGSMRVGSQPGVAASGQQVVPQGSMRVGSQPGVAPSGQVVPQGSMRVGSQPGVAASGQQMVPQGSMRVGSQPGVAASGQVMPQGSMRVGSQPFDDTTVSKPGAGMHVTQSVHFVDDVTVEMTTEVIENADDSQMVVMYDRSEQGLVPSIQPGSRTAAGASSGQMVPQSSAQLGSRTAAAASAQVVPQGSTRIGSQPGVAASGQLAPKGSMRVGSQPGVAASRQVVPQGSMRVGSQPGVAASGQVAPQGSMRVGSQPGVAASGQVAPQAPAEQVVAEQSVQMITTELGSKVSAFQSVQMAKEESVPAIDASGLPTETGGAEVGGVTVTQSVALVPDAATETVDVDVTQTVEVVTAPDQAVAGEAVGHVSPKKAITAADAQGSQQAPQEMTPQFSAPRHPTECICADCICSDCSGKKAQVTPKRDEISSSKTDAKAAKSSSKADTPAAKPPSKAEAKPVKSSSKAGMEVPPPFVAPTAGPCDCKQCICEVCPTKGQGRPGSAKVTPKRAKGVGRDVARPPSPVHCDCPTCTCPEDLMENVMLSRQAVGEPSKSPKPSRREGRKMKTSDACTCERNTTSRSRPTTPKSRDKKKDVGPVDLKEIDSATLQKKIQAGRKENCECKEHIKEIKTALAKIKCACDQAEQRSKNSKAFVKKASEFGQTMSGLKMALQNLQDKCKAKDRMIEAMAGELKLRTSEKTMDQVFSNIQKHGAVPDYDKGDDVKGKGSGNQPPTKILYTTEEERGEGGSRQKKKRTKKDCKCATHQVAQKEEKDCQKIDLGNFEVTDIRRITDDSIIVKWTASSDEDICGYDIFVNGVMSSKVMSGARTSAMVYSLDLSRTIQITIYTVTKCGRCEPPAIAIYEIDSK